MLIITCPAKVRSNIDKVYLLNIIGKTYFITMKIIYFDLNYKSRHTNRFDRDHMSTFNYSD